MVKTRWGTFVTGVVTGILVVTVLPGLKVLVGLVVMLAVVTVLAWVGMKYHGDTGVTGLVDQGLGLVDHVLSMIQDRADKAVDFWTSDQDQDQA